MSPPRAERPGSGIRSGPATRPPCRRGPAGCGHGAGLPVAEKVTAAATGNSDGRPAWPVRERHTRLEQRTPLRLRGRCGQPCVRLRTAAGDRRVVHAGSRAEPTPPPPAKKESDRRPASGARRIRVPGHGQVTVRSRVRSRVRSPDRAPGAHPATGPASKLRREPERPGHGPASLPVLRDRAVLQHSC